MTAYLQRQQRRVWGQIARPPTRASLPPMPRTGLRAGRGAERGSPYEGESAEPAENAGDRINEVRRQAARRAWESPVGEGGADPPSEGPTLRPARGSSSSAPPAPSAALRSGTTTGAPTPPAPASVTPAPTATQAAPTQAPSAQPAPTQAPRQRRAKLPQSTKDQADEEARDAQGNIRCQSCGVITTDPTPRTKGSRVAKTERQYDHIISRKKGGGDEPSNMNVKCADCNNRKGAKYWEPWLKHER